MNDVDKWINDHALDSISMSEGEFKRMHMNEYRPDERYNLLIDRLAKYYIDTENVSNKVAMGMWKDFKKWARYCGGYTNEEINKAKRNNQFRI